MAKSDARFSYRANLNRESHDLSRNFGFTAQPGMLLPVFHDIATPGDTYYIEHNLTYLRTLPLAAPAMCDLIVHYESFFVPFQMIYQPMEQTLFSLTDFQSSFYNSSFALNNELPLVNMPEFIRFVNATYKQSVFKSDVVRLFDMFGMNASMFIYDGDNPSVCDYAPNFFPYQFLAYQAIYNYFYRLDDKSHFNHGAFNWDEYYATSNPIVPIIDLFELRQRARDFDYYTSLYRSPIVSDANMQRLLGDASYSKLVNSDTAPLGNMGNIPSNNSDVRSFGGKGYPTFSNDTIRLEASTASIRQMFANEKLSMITGRARKTYDSQVLAHFGTEVPHDPKHDIALIGSDSYPIQIGEVTSLASTNESGLGDLAGKGWATGHGRKHKFIAPCHGVVMTIFSVEPKVRYYGGFDKINTLTNAFDIPTPEFDRLGNVPMFRYETGEKVMGETWSDIVGWKERYYANKRRHDQVTLAFKNTNQFGVYNDKSAYMITQSPFGSNAARRGGDVSSRPDLENRFYVDRNALDNLMLAPVIQSWQNGANGQATNENWNATPWLMYARDPFIVDSYEKVTKVSWMSKDGEPVYNF